MQQMEDNSINSNNNSWNDGIVVSDGDFISVDSSGVDGSRGVDGSLAVLDFLKLAPGSDLVGAGIDVGLTTDGAGELYLDPPAIGAYEYSSGGGINYVNFLRLGNNLLRYFNKLLR